MQSFVLVPLNLSKGESYLEGVATLSDCTNKSLMALKYSLCMCMYEWDGGILSSGRQNGEEVASCLKKREGLA